MKENGLRIKLKDKESTFTGMVQCTMGNGTKISKKGTERKHGKMNHISQGCIRVGKKMGKVFVRFTYIS